MAKNRILDALERAEERRVQQEEIPEGLQQAIKRTQNAMSKAFGQVELKGIKSKTTFEG